MDRQEDKQEQEASLLKDFFIPLIFGLTIVLLLRGFVFGLYHIPSESMVPTLEVHDRVVVSKLSYVHGEPERGDVVVFKYPGFDESGEQPIYIKRLVGLPGDKVEIRQNQVLVNGRALKESYIAKDADMGDFGPYTVGEDEFFMMGDNRNHSNDSRFWGTVPRDLLIGKAEAVFWPVKHWASLR